MSQHDIHQHDLPRLLAFADTLADAARAAILPYFRATHGVRDKGGGRFDPVTDADNAAEHTMRELIVRQFPGHGIVGEEFGEAHGATGDGANGYQWILDPIDGTRAFIAGLPTWGVLVGLYCKGRPVLGIMDQPYLDERYRGWNVGAELTARGQTRQLRVRQCNSLSEAILCTTDPYLFEGEEAHAFSRVRDRAKLTRYGYDCYAYSMVAAGGVDCVVESGLKIFDIAALIPILNGAGGGVCSWDGGEATLGGRVLAYGDKRVRDAVIKLLAG